MANSTTLSQLRTRARRAADMVNTAFVSDAELTDWINVSLSELHDLLVNSFEDYFEVQFPITVISGTSAYALPTDFYKAIGVDFNTGGDTYSLRRYMPTERNLYNNFVAQAYAGFVTQFYRIVASELRFIPNPLSGTATVRYVPQFAPLVNNTDLVNSAVPQGWEEYAVVDTAIRMLIKEESDIAALQMQKDRLTARIERAAEDRDAGEPWRISDKTAIDVFTYGGFY